MDLIGLDYGINDDKNFRFLYLPSPLWIIYNIHYVFQFNNNVKSFNLMHMRSNIAKFSHHSLPWIWVAEKFSEKCWTKCFIFFSSYVLLIKVQLLWLRHKKVRTKQIFRLLFYGISTFFTLAPLSFSCIIYIHFLYRLHQISMLLFTSVFLVLWW